MRLSDVLFIIAFSLVIVGGFLATMGYLYGEQTIEEVK